MGADKTTTTTTTGADFQLTCELGAPEERLAAAAAAAQLGAETKAGRQNKDDSQPARQTQTLDSCHASQGHKSPSSERVGAPRVGATPAPLPSIIRRKWERDLGAQATTSSSSSTTTMTTNQTEPAGRPFAQPDDVRPISFARAGLSVGAQISPGTCRYSLSLSCWRRQPASQPAGRRQQQEQ